MLEVSTPAETPTDPLFELRWLITPCKELSWLELVVELEQLLEACTGCVTSVTGIDWGRHRSWQEQGIGAQVDGVVREMQESQDLEEQEHEEH